ncbi:hypothetical protein D9756_008182 [Leucocoprinus leucothites]|uniref:Protein kinase domain-containing protein n=1 Tax=Leucocoprinus leucothites TaxID=201217 RepID=A0A8H5FVE2_9AGAR|nr:hypothetical protein D9756_008182 [Leucoagaricus leucothites]
MSDNRHIQIAPGNDGLLIQGFPGIPPNSNFQHGAKIEGEVQISLPLLGVAASKIEIKFYKSENVKVKGQRTINTVDLLDAAVLWESNFYRSETTDSYAGKYPFSLDIPEDLPPTLCLEKQGIDIQYLLEATVYRDNEIKFWKEKPLSCTLPLEITKYEHHPAWPMYHQPEATHLDLASMRLSVTPIRKCYSPGETIMLTARLSCGSYSVVPRNVKLEVKLLQQIITTSKPSGPIRQLLRQSDKAPPTINVLSTQAVGCARVDHTATFTAELVCEVPETDVMPTLAYRSHIQITYALVVATVVHSQHLQLEVPVIISPFPSDIPDAEIQKIGIVPSLGGIPHFERPSSNMLYAQTLVERFTLGTPAEAPTLDTVREDDENINSSARFSRSTELSSTTLVDSPDSDIRIRVTDVDRNSFLTSRTTQRTGSISTVDSGYLIPGSPIRNRLESSHLVQLDEEILASWFKSLNSKVADNGASNTISSDPVGYLGLVGDLTDILQSPEKKKVLLGLRGYRAQVIVDFLDSVLVEMDPSKIELRKQVLITLYRICKASHCYPECYTLHNIVIGTQEGGGGFCDIHRGRHRDQVLCLKVVRMFKKNETHSMIKLFAKEAILWSQLNHPNILPFYGIYYLGEENKRICLVSPWMENGNLVNYLQENPTVARRPFVSGQSFFAKAIILPIAKICDVITGLEYLHERNIIHGDLKGVNVLVTSFGRACITDFGLSSVLVEKSITEAAMTPSVIHGGSYRWIAPELLEADSHPTQASDIWAFGCLCYQILTRRVPFHKASSDPAVIKLILNGETPTHHHSDSPESGPDTINDEMGPLLKRCWTFPKERPTCRQIMEILGIWGLAGRHDTITNSQVAEFRSAMRNKGNSPVDLAGIDSIFSEIKRTGSTDQKKSPNAYN